MYKVLFYIKMMILCLLVLCGCEHVHDFYIQSTVEPQCEETGINNYRCECEETKIENISAIGHVWNAGEITIKPTCVDVGEMLYSCSICDKTYTEDIDATGNHIWNDGYTAVEATCITKGEYTYSCEYCTETKSEILEATGEHIYDNGKISNEPTCVEEGTFSYTCSVCGNVKTEKIPINDTHIWDNGVVSKEATCKKIGETIFTCTICQKTKTENISVINTHKWNNGIIVMNATCGVNGKMKYTCSICDKIKEEVIAATGKHTWDNGKITTAATAESYGNKTYACKVCGELRYETIAKLQEINGYKIIASGTAANKMELSLAALSGKEAKGSTLNWTLTEDGVLRISGKGEMADYCSPVLTIGLLEKKSFIEWNDETYMRPWHKYTQQINTVIIEEGCTYIGNAAFAYCENLYEVQLPVSLKELGGAAFQGCGNLKDTAINLSNVEDIGYGTFAKCASFVNLTLNNIDYIPAQAFRDCINLENVVFSNKLYRLDWGVFENCRKIKTIILPETFNKMTHEALANMNLESVYFYGDVPDTSFDEWVDKGLPLIQNTYINDEGKVSISSNQPTIYYVDGKRGWTSPQWTGPDHVVYNTAIIPK